MNYRRIYIKGGTYFFTIVTYNRIKILNYPENIKLINDALHYVNKNHPFYTNAYVILPEHIHLIMNLPENDGDFSTRIRLLKSYFSRYCDKQYKSNPTDSRKKRNEQAIWQHRFWEHLIRDEEDYQKHVKYIHYNPVKHGLVNAPVEWEYTSLHKYIQDGIYDKDWGVNEKPNFDKSIGME